MILFDFVGSWWPFLGPSGFRHGSHGARLGPILTSSCGLADMVGPKMPNIDLLGCVWGANVEKNLVNGYVLKQGNWSSN